MLSKCLKVFLIFHFTVLNNPVEMCSRKCEKYKYKSHSPFKRFLEYVPDFKTLNDLALIGTHYSTSYGSNNEVSRTQDFNISQQLDYGVRVLDIDMPPNSNLMEHYSSPDFSGIKFREILQVIGNFLDQNPKEFVIMLMTPIHRTVIDTFKSSCNVVDYYMINFEDGKRFVKNWQFGDTIGQYRGKILLASLNNFFYGCSVQIHRQCDVQSDKVIYMRRSTHMSVEEKWNFAYQLMNDKSTKHYICSFNDISFRDVEYTPRVIAKDGGYNSKDGCVVPINHKMATHFTRSYYGLIIVLADYVTDELIDQINQSNFQRVSCSKDH